jgi:hypothetical protein
VPPLWFLAIDILSLKHLLQVRHLMYRLKCPFGLTIYYHHLCFILLFIVTVGLMFHIIIASMFEMLFTYLREGMCHGGLIQVKFTTA